MFSQIAREMKAVAVMDTRMAIVRSEAIPIACISGRHDVLLHQVERQYERRRSEEREHADDEPRLCLARRDQPALEQPGKDSPGQEPRLSSPSTCPRATLKLTSLPAGMPE